MVIVNIKKEDSKKAFKKEAVFKVPKIKGYPTIRIEKGCDFQRNTNFSYSSQPLQEDKSLFYILYLTVNYQRFYYFCEIDFKQFFILMYFQTSCFYFFFCILRYRSKILKLQDLQR